MAIVDRPTMAPGPSAIQPYLQGFGRRKIEDEIATMLLGINPTDRANMGGALPGGTGGGGGGFAGTAPGGGGGAAQSAAAVPASLMLGSVPAAGGAFQPSGDGANFGMDAPAVASPDQSWGGVLGAARTLAGFAANPVLSAALFAGTAIANPAAQTAGISGLLGGKPGSIGASIADTLGGYGIGMGGPSPGDGKADGTDGGDKKDGGDKGAETAPGGSGSDVGGTDAGGTNTGGAEFGGVYMAGGYTGHGGDGAVQPTEPAGTVHEGEYVIPADVVAMLGVPFFHGIVEMERGRMNPNIQQAPVNKPPMQGMESMPYQEEIPDEPEPPQMPDGKQRFTPAVKPPEERLAMTPQMLAMLGMG